MFFSFLTSLPSLSFVLNGAFSQSLTHALFFFGGSAGLGGGSAGRSLRSRSGGGSLGCRSGGAGSCADAGVASDQGSHPDGGAHGRDPAGAPPLVQEVRNVICHEYKPFLESWSVQLTPRRASMNCAPI